MSTTEAKDITLSTVKKFIVLTLTVNEAEALSAIAPTGNQVTKRAAIQLQVREVLATLPPDPLP